MDFDCDVIIAGAGPVGLFMAAELGMRGLSVYTFDDKPGTSTHPAANANSARTMEHFRRLGLSAEVRSLGLPADHPTDVAYFTRLSTHELARLHQPSSSFAVNRVRELESIWPTPNYPTVVRSFMSSRYFAAPPKAMRAIACNIFPQFRM